MAKNPTHQGKSSTNLASLIRAHRVASGMTSAAVARALGITRQGWFALEWGHEGLPVRHIHSIASTLNIDPPILTAFALEDYTQRRRQAYTARVLQAAG